jgi:nucleotide-binding universal stress UspA family protein
MSLRAGWAVFCLPGFGSALSRSAQSTKEVTVADEAYRIVVGYDFSDLADLALLKAFQLASREKNGEVHVVHIFVPVVDVTEVAAAGAVPADLGPAIGETYEALEARVGQAMAAWQSETGLSFSRLSVHVRTELATSEVAQLAADLDAELVVVGTHGRRGIRRFLLGSVAEAVVRQSPCPVLVVRPKAPHPEEPQIQPPCPACLEARKATQGKQFWCEQHGTRHGQRHTYHHESRLSQPTNPPFFYGTR